MARSLAAVLAVLGCVLAATAHAVPFTVVTEPQANHPNVAVDSDGDSHVVWSSGSGARELRHCVVRPASASCDPATIKTLHVGITNNPSPHVFATGASDVVVSGTVAVPPNSGHQVWAWRSSDGGATFAAGAPIMPVFPGQARGFADAALGPGDALSILDEAPGSGGSPMYVRGPLSGPPATGTADLGSKITGTSRATDGEQVAVAGSTPVVVSKRGDGSLEYAYYGGPGDPNDPSSWVGPIRRIPPNERVGITAMVAGGPKGLILVYGRYGIPGPGWVIWAEKFDPATGRFGVPVYVTEVRDGFALRDVYADPATGVFHVIYRTNSDPTKIGWSASSDALRWARLKPVGDSPGGFALQMAAGPTATGLVVWDDAETIRALRMVPALEPTPPPPPFSGVLRSVRVSDSRGTFTFTVPRECVQPGQAFKATLQWRRKKRKGNLFVKVRRADFYIGRTRVKTDRRAPFRQTLTVNATQRRGSVLALRARAFIKVKRGKSPTKSIRARVRICP